MDMGGAKYGSEEGANIRDNLRIRNKGKLRKNGG